MPIIFVPTAEHSIVLCWYLVPRIEHSTVPCWWFCAHSGTQHWPMLIFFVFTAEHSSDPCWYLTPTVEQSIVLCWYLMPTAEHSIFSVFLTHLRFSTYSPSRTNMFFAVSLKAHCFPSLCVITTYIFFLLNTKQLSLYF